MKNPMTARETYELASIITKDRSEAEIWVALETICLCIGLSFGRTQKDIAIFIETMAERIATGARDEIERPKP